MSQEFSNKLYYFISGQLPEYIVAEYPVFVTFLEKYYKFLETDDQVHQFLLNSSSWSDIDHTLEIFLPEFRKQYAAELPENTVVSLRRLLKYIYDYYDAKGSENAVELFFRFMYNEKATVIYPGDFILRASDGRWSRKRIVKLDNETPTDFTPTHSDPFDLSGKKIKFVYLETIPGQGRTLRSIETSCFNVVKGVHPFIYELEIDLTPNYVFPEIISAPVNQDINGDGTVETIPTLGDYDTHIYVVYNENIYGTLTKQVVDVVDINTTGSNFRIDDAYKVSEGGVEGLYFASDYVYDTTSGEYSPYVIQSFVNNAIIRVKEVTAFTADSPTGILELQIVNTGHRFTARELSDVGDLSYFAEELEGDPPAITSYVDGNGTPYVEGNADLYAVDTAVYQPVEEFTVELTPRYPRNISGTSSSITFKTGIIYHASGSYKDSSGFLSDINKLQDNYYYQPYSYVIQSQKPFNVWKTDYLKNNHPAGFSVFAEVQIIDTINISVTATLDNFNVIFMSFEDEVTVTETVEKGLTIYLGIPYFAHIDSEEDTTPAYYTDFIETGEKYAEDDIAYPVDEIITSTLCNPYITESYVDTGYVNDCEE